jgi:hypothetical protein
MHAYVQYIHACRHAHIHAYMHAITHTCMQHTLILTCMTHIHRYLCICMHVSIQCIHKRKLIDIHTNIHNMKMALECTWQWIHFDNTHTSSLHSQINTHKFQRKLLQSHKRYISTRFLPTMLYTYHKLFPGPVPTRSTKKLTWHDRHTNMKKRHVSHAHVGTKKPYTMNAVEHNQNTASSTWCPKPFIFRKMKTHFGIQAPTWETRRVSKTASFQTPPPLEWYT